MKHKVLLRAIAIAAAGVISAGCAGAPHSVAPRSPMVNGATPALPLSATVPKAPPLLRPPTSPGKTGRRPSAATPLTPFFSGAACTSSPCPPATGTPWYYLKFPNGNVFGYYNDLGGNWILHADLGYEYYQDANDGQAGIYFYDQQTGHWWYTSPTYPFPYVYDFRYASVLWYEPSQTDADHYTTGPRWFRNFKFGRFIKLPGDIVWQMNGPGSPLGPYNQSSGGQCSNQTFPSAHDVTFTLARDQNGPSGTSACYRDQINPQSGGRDFFLQYGSIYTFTFETVVTLNGHYTYAYNGSASNSFDDLPGSVWQTHDEYGSYVPPSPGATPSPPDACAALVLENTKFVDNSWQGTGTPYPGTPSDGLPAWGFVTCDDGIQEGASGAYHSTNTLPTSGSADDTWEMDILAQPKGSAASGYIGLTRNASIVFPIAPASVCNPGYAECWWNFGPYMYQWQNSQTPPSWTAPGAVQNITVTYKNMTLYQN